MLVAAILSWAVAALGLVVGIFDAQLHWEGWALFGLGISIGIVSVDFELDRYAGVMGLARAPLVRE